MFYKLYIIFVSHLGTKSRVVTEVQKAWKKVQKSKKCDVGATDYAPLFYKSNYVYWVVRHMYISLLHVWGYILEVILFALLQK